MVRKKPVVLIIGASSGLGNFTAMYLAKKGYRVYGTTRNPGAVFQRADEFFDYLELDVTNTESVKSVINSILDLEGKIDIVLYCAAIWQTGAIEDTKIEEIEAMFETNFLGALRLISCILKPMRESGGGRLLFVSGISGIEPFPFQASFCSTKAALESVVRVLRMETRDQGIQVILIEPGDFVTMSPAGKKTVTNAFSSDSFYREQFDKTVAVIAHDTLRGSMPIQFAKTIEKAIEDEKPRRRYRSGAGFVYDLKPLLIHLPEKITDFLIRKYYGIS